MTQDIDRLVTLFCKHGGKFENMTISHKQDSGFYCKVINNHHNAMVFCPARLLVNVEDIGINKTGLFITRPENYADDIEFLEKYFSFHFDHKLVDMFLEEKRQIDSMSEHERLLLKKINIPYIPDEMDDDIAYVKGRILKTHMFSSKSLGKNVIMPFVTFLNHDQDGGIYQDNANGITVSGKFEDEVFAHYHMADVLLFLGDHGFVTDTKFIYSLPMWLTFHNGITLKINRDFTKFRLINGKFRWPEVQKKGNEITVSWFPIYFSDDLKYPSEFAISLAREFRVPAAEIVYFVFRHNLNILLPIVFSLKDSKNSYVRTVVSGVERQLELLGGITNGVRLDGSYRDQQKIN